MKVEYLREFSEFAETLNYTETAKRLYITQPALSSHVAELEKLIGTPLVESIDNKFVLTPAGRHLLGKANTLVKELDTIFEECRDLGRNIVSVNMRSDNSCYSELLSRAKSLYSQKHKDKAMEYRFVTQSRNQAEAINRGVFDLDIGLIYHLSNHELPTQGFPSLKNFSYFPQIKLKFQFWITAKHRLFKKEKIFLKDIAGSTLFFQSSDAGTVLGEQVIKEFERLSIPLDICYHKFDSLTDYHYHDITDCIGGTCSAMSQSTGLNRLTDTRRVFYLEDVDLSLTLYTVYREDLLDNDKLAFIEILKSLAELEVSI